MDRSLLTDQGSIADRPAAGVKGRFWWATDETVAYIDTGTEWERVPALDPVSAVDWHAAFWAEDPNWTPPADGGSVTSWNDASGNGRHATAGTAAQYLASDAKLGGKPSVHNNKSGGAWLTTPAWTALAQPNTIFMVGWSATGDGLQGYFFDGIESGARHYLAKGSAGSGYWRMYAGISGGVDGPANDQAAHAFECQFDATDRLLIDGVQVDSGDAGADSLTGLGLLGWVSGAISSRIEHLAFLGIHDGLLTQEQRDDLVAWSQLHYGTP